jgi:hypothetical protein
VGDHGFSVRPNEGPQMRRPITGMVSEYVRFTRTPANAPAWYDG